MYWKKNWESLPITKSTNGWGVSKIKHYSPLQVFLDVNGCTLRKAPFAILPTLKPNPATPFSQSTLGAKLWLKPPPTTFKIPLKAKLIKIKSAPIRLIRVIRVLFLIIRVLFLIIRVLFQINRLNFLNSD